MFRSATFSENICILPYYHYLLPLCQAQSVDAMWPSTSLEGRLADVLRTFILQNKNR